MSNKKEYRKQYYIDNRKKILEYGKQYNQENKENKKEYDKQYNQKNREKGLEYSKQYYQENKEKISEQYRQQCKDNPKKNKEQRIQYYQKNRNKIRERVKQWRNNNIEYMKEYNKKYYQKNKGEMDKQAKQWRKDNSEKINRYQKDKYKTDLKYNLNGRIRKVIRKSLGSNKNGHHWETLVGYTLIDLIKRLEKTMPINYNWNDYLEGKLHIDHIIPISVFNFDKPEHPDFKRCWALENLRLLSARENIRKHNKLTKPFQPALAININ